MKNPLVVGYKGEIGSYILNGLIKYMPKAVNIMCYDINENEGERIERINKADVIFLCVPIQKTSEFFHRYHFYLKGKYVVEQTSLKSYLFNDRIFKKYSEGCHVLSMHVMFRPSGTPDKNDHYVALMERNSWKWTCSGVLQFLYMGLKIKEVHFSTIEQHDAAMAYQQALVHRVLLVLDECMRTEAPCTFISKRVRELANRISLGDKNLYEIIQNNPNLKGTLRNFEKKIRQFKINHFITG